MFEFRLNKVRIENNQTGPQFIIIGKDIAKIKFYSFITTSSFTFPGLDEIKDSETTYERKREIIKNATKQVASLREFPTIAKIKDNHAITFGKYGYVLHRSIDTIPRFFDWSFFAIKSNKSSRELGQQMDATLNNSDFDDVTNNVLTLINKAANPSYIAGALIAKFVAGLIAEGLKSKDDGQIGSMITSFNEEQHYPHGELKDDEVKDLSGNMLVDYSIFATDS